jgi:hypothetical protein
MYKEFDPGEVTFHPAVPKPKLKPKQRQHFSAQTMLDPVLRDQAEQALMDRAVTCDFWTSVCPAQVC